MDDVLSKLKAPSTTGASSLVDDIQSSLRDAIARGVLSPGYRLREAPLAAHFGCSATPVREAIRNLEAEGLVKVYPRVGARVSSFSRSEVEHLYELRLLLEPYTARKAAEARPTSPDLDRVRELIEQQDVTASEAPETPIDAEIHRELAELADNPIIARLIGQTTRQIEAVQSRLGAWVARGTETAHLAHLDIIEAIAQGDGDRAEILMREHLGLAREAVLAHLDAASSA